MRVKVAIYDDNPMVIAGLNHLLSEKNFDIVGFTTDPDELIRCILLIRPDFIIIDPVLLKEEHLLKLNQLAAIIVEMKIVVYAGSASAYHILRNHGLNWTAYLSKNQPFEQLIDALQQQYDNKLASSLVQYIPGVRGFKESELLVNLTYREMQVLREIGAGKTNKKIADEMHLSNKTISTYKRNIMDKFKTNDVRDIVDFARRHGF